jgi:midasin
VLEALNRLLDDNRELYIPETQTLITPHPHFMLFATQNPPGLYGGRKVLSRAFRNRFLELHFDDIPDGELEQILQQRCRLPPKWAKTLVLIMRDLHRHRQGSALFAGKHGFITLRDLFRWADRSSGVLPEFAAEGYMLLAERLRNESEKAVVRQVLQDHFRVQIDVPSLYLCDDDAFQATLALLRDHEDFAKIVWTKQAKRMFVLIEKCLKHGEPCLLVGDTGTGIYF